jgi:predicted site-specific integrase-resolvase
MSSNDQPSAAQASAGMRGEIQKQWSKFTYAEVSALKSKDDLVAQVQTKYALDKTQAEKDVNAFAKGRQL